MNPNYNHTDIEIEEVIGVATEWDEFWSYFGSKANQRWTWYLINRNNGLSLLLGKMEEELTRYFKNC